MPPDLQKWRVTQHYDRRVASINPLDCDPIPVSLNYINGMYWVGHVLDGARRRSRQLDARGGLHPAIDPPSFD